MANEFSISGRLIGPQHPPLVIAEIGINHEGSIDLAIAMVDKAIDAGAEVIKHQTHIVDDEMSNEAQSVIPGNANVSIYEIMRRCALNEQDEFRLMQYVQKKGGIFISTPFSREGANRLNKFQVPAFKIGSGECNNYPLVKYIAGFGKPIILSTGMNSIETIKPAVEIIESQNLPYALLHCTNAYPTPPEDVRLGAIEDLRREFPNAILGLSDHTESNYSCFGAVALGASILERHFTDSMNRPGPDIICSMDPESLSELIRGSKIIHKALGGNKVPHSSEGPTIAFAFASVVSIKEITKGDRLTHENIWVKRPGGGDFSAKEYESLIGKIASKDIALGCQIRRVDLIE